MNEHDRTQAWRDALGDLAAPPHLLDDVLEAVRTTAAQVRRHRRWSAAPGLRWGALAALVLATVGGVMWLNGPAEEGSEGPRVTFSGCASADEIDWLRDEVHPTVSSWLANRLLVPTENAPWAFAASSRGQVDVPGDGATQLDRIFVRTKLVGTGMSPAEPSAPTSELPPTAVRSVVRFDTGWDVMRTWSASASWPEGVAAVGEQLLSRLREHAGEEAVATWQGHADAFILLETDEPAPLRARARVATRALHDGSLLLPEPLARALRMHQFELPGSIDVRSRSPAGDVESEVRCRRAWTRVRVPELGFDEAFEIAVAPPQWPSLAATADDGSLRHALHLTGEPVLDVLGWERGRIHGGTDVRRGVVSLQTREPPGLGLEPRAAEQGGGVHAVLQGPGAARLALYFADGAVLLLPDIEVGGHGGKTPTQAIERTTLRLPGEPVAPGTRIVLAEVWRGGEAVAGPAGICVTRVADDGTVSWVHTPSVDPATLRIAVVDVDRVVRFIDGAEGPAPATPAVRRRR